MRPKSLVHVFLRSAGLLLLATGFAKLISGAGTTPILLTHDPILVIETRFVLLGIGEVEIVVALLCLLAKKFLLRTAAVVWLATNFAAYRAGLLLIGGKQHCPCMGDLTDVLHISPQAADMAAGVVLVYLWLGGCAILLWLWSGGSRPRL